MRVKDKRVLKNGAIAGYVYYSNEKKWKWRIIGRSKTKKGGSAGNINSNSNNNGGRGNGRGRGNNGRGRGNNGRGRGNNGRGRGFALAPILLQIPPVYNANEFNNMNDNVVYENVIPQAPPVSQYLAKRDNHIFIINLGLIENAYEVQRISSYNINEVPTVISIEIGDIVQDNNIIQTINSHIMEHQQ